ncbi:phosphoserine phosphatase SerB [Herbaspirillum seropedicae]|uniref:phosphoserine phosphatase SerB n=1 Tax=Herbaspirillum seropedicae TaxID=964 RepID=UPI003FCE32DC
MNLILQAPKQHAVSSSALEAIAALAGGQVERISDARVPDADAWRVAGVSLNEALKASVDAACLQARLDYAFIDAGRKLADFRLVAMDMDSTLITIECIDEIADMQGLKPQVAEITEAAMRGEIEFNESLTRRVALLKGLDAGALQRVYDERLQLSPGAENMLKAVQAAGLKTLLVSGGFTFFTDRMKARLNLDYTHANTLEVVDGKLTGKVVGGIVNADEKRATVERVCREIGAEPAKAIVMGDGANDLRMMGISGLSVAFRAKPVVRAQASVGLNFVGLDGILNLLA